MSKLEYLGLSFVGRRESNQDNFLTLKVSDDVLFLAVADGMGGVSGGQIASQLVTRVAQKYIEKIDRNKFKRDLKSILHGIYRFGQKVIAQYTQKHPEHRGMGTTLTSVLIYKTRFVVGNLGDSRVYLLRNGNLTQMTTDHTYIQDYMNREGQEQDPAILVKYSHLLTRTMDGGKDLPDIFPVEKNYESLEPGDLFLLCSDGMILEKDNKDTTILKNFILGSPTLERTAQNLIAHAFHAGSTDNITAVLASYGKISRQKIDLPKYSYPPSDKENTTLVLKKEKFKKHLLLSLLLILLLSSLALFLIRQKGTVSKEIRAVQTPVQTKNDSSLAAQDSTMQTPAFVDSIRWMPGQTSDLPKSELYDLSWIPPMLKNDQVKNYNVFLYDSPSNKPIDSLGVKTPTIKLKNFAKLTLEGTYYFKVRVNSEHGLKQETHLKKIIFKLMRQKK